MRLAISTLLNTPAERAWTEVQSSRLLAYIAWPLLTFKPMLSNRFPMVWTDGTHPVRVRGFGVVPMGKQMIGTTRPKLGPERYQIRDNGSGDFASRWDHLITIETTGPDQCRYTDEVEVRAGIFTPVVWGFAVMFYTHRQRRWRQLVGRGFAY